MTTEHLEYLVSQGDEDANVVQQFERDFEEMLQEIPDMQQAMVSYNEARQRINDRRRSRGFWPTGKGKGKGGFKDGSRPYRKGGGKSGKEELLARIAKTHCKLCGALGHWRAECPQRKETRESANVAFSMPSEASDAEEETNQVVFEALSEQECIRCETCFVASCHRNSVLCKQNVEDVKAFWGKKLDKPGYKRGNKGVIGYNGVTKNCGPENVLKPEVVTTALHTHAARKMHPRPTNRADGFVSQNHSDAMQSQGMAILDTGASRSVIGQDHVPAMLQKLPASVRDQVVEKPSRVGFRFGNNQVAYSYKQLRIPLVHKGIRIWLLIEVVPKATPFLLSIKTMKSLGAMIDLGQNTCFLKTLQRSLYLKENKNGLFMIDMSDLCQPDVKSNAAAFVASSVCAPPPGLESEIPVSHADTQEVLDALRTVAKEVLASLKLLMTIVFTMTSAIDPNQRSSR